MSRPGSEEFPLLTRGFGRRLDRQYIFPIGPVAILNAKRNRCTYRLAVPHSRENIRAVFFYLLPPAAPVAELSAGAVHD